MTDELLQWRREFPILEKTVYLISHSLGAMPRATFDRMQAYAETWATRGVRAWAEGWWDMPLTVGDEVGRIIGAETGTTVMHQNVSVCQSLILSCFDPEHSEPKRNKIVYSELEFPSVKYVYEAHARGGRFRIEKVKSDDGITVPLERMLAAIDEETLLVPIWHVLFKSAFLQDARRITERAHEVGALVVLDTYQSAGTVPLSVRDLDVDFATGGSVKWLCGGPGAGYLYVAQSGYQIINKIGVEMIRAKSVGQTTRLIGMLEEEGFRVTSPRDPEQRGGTLTVAVEHAAAVTKELIDREIIVDYRPGAGIRISPHFYTKDEELEIVVREIRKIIDTRAYTAHETAGAAF